MKVAAHAPSNSQIFPTWALKYKPIKPKPSLKPLALSNSLSTTSFKFSHGYQQEEKFNSTHHLAEDGKPDKFNLPVAIRGGDAGNGAVSRCFWDGGELKFVAVDGGDDFSMWDSSLSFEDGVTKFSRFCTVAVRNLFLPRKVSVNYLEYVKWKFLHRVFSSALQVLATQAMFRAIGIGYSRALPSAAALNWVLKDGLGRLSRCIYTATLASAFDTNLKRVRFSTSVLFSLSIGVELLTPVFPKYFLLLATIANIAKQISLACYLATGSAVHKSFAISDNIGEVSAKAQIQTVCFDNVGLLLAATLNILFRNNQRLLAALPFVVYPIFSAFDLYGIYQGLKHVHLQTLTKDRLESVINIWIHRQYIPSPAEVSTKEGINFMWSRGRELLPIRIGCLNPERKIPKPSLTTVRFLKDEDLYFICMESINNRSAIKDHGILLSLREGAGTTDVIMGLLQACYIRKRLLHDINNHNNYFEDCDTSNSVTSEWLLLINESKRFAEADLDLLIDNMSGLGWACKNILLSTKEQARYSFVVD